MKEINTLFEQNKKWAEELRKNDPEFFIQSAKGQKPEYLWIGCSDSRVPPNQLLGVLPGEVFVHRNIANVVHENDVSIKAVVNFAVGVLKVKNVILCGHLGCGGVQASTCTVEDPDLKAWLRPISETYEEVRGREDFKKYSSEEQITLLCKLNIVRQIKNLLKIPIIENKVSQEELTIHGWIYRLHDGQVEDLGVSVKNNKDIASLGFDKIFK